jgi:hypothetical protein
MVCFGAGGIAAPMHTSTTGASGTSGALVVWDQAPVAFAVFQGCLG